MMLGEGAWPYLFLFVAGFVATEPWRYFGVFLSKDLDVDSEILVWVQAVSTGLIAGLVARLIVFPAGALAATTLPVRLLAFAFGVAVYLGWRRNLAAGIFGGAGALVLLDSLLRG